MHFPKIASFRSAEALRRHAATLGIPLACDDVLESGPQSPLARPVPWEHRTIGNRFAVLPMEGWDGTAEGKPTDLTLRRWRRFGLSGAKLIWGCEAAAVRHDGRANPHQLLINEANLSAIAEAREILVNAHRERFGGTDDLVVGLQLTHSGRFSRPNDSRRIEPRVAYRHPLLDARFSVVSDAQVFTDDELDQLVIDFVQAAGRAARAGFDFVDIKHCHGYLAHELLSAVERPGRYGGSFENRTRFLRSIVDGIRPESPKLGIGVRLSLFDQLPFQPGADRVGIATPWQGPYPFAFGADPLEPARIAWKEPLAFLALLQSLGVRLVCLSCGSPYYNPHLQRPAAAPPSDGYLPPEDPLVGVARQLSAVARARAEFPNLLFVGSGYSYLQDWLPQVGQAQVAAGAVDFIGLGRMILSYPELPDDVISGRPLDRRRVCRTFSECTTGPRNGLVSGCFPLDDFYKVHPAAAALKALRQEAARS